MFLGANSNYNCDRKEPRLLRMFSGLHLWAYPLWSFLGGLESVACCQKAAPSASCVLGSAETAPAEHMTELQGWIPELVDDITVKSMIMIYAIPVERTSLVLVFRFCSWCCLREARTSSMFTCTAAWTGSDDYARS